MSGVQTLNGEGSAEEQPPAWVEPGLRCLIRALQGGSVKVQWNACYAVGAILRCQHAAAAAQRAGLLTQLLRQLLQTLQHSSNFKASTRDAPFLNTLHCMHLIRCKQTMICRHSRFCARKFAS